MKRQPFAGLLKIFVAALVFFLIGNTLMTAQSPEHKRGFGGQLEHPTPEKLAQYRSESRANLLSLPPLAPFSQSLTILEHTPKAEASAADPVFSWRAVGIVTDARDQGTCGSCSVFACVAAAEANWTLRHHGQLTDMSEQHLVDCVDGNCCAGWAPSAVMDYLVAVGIGTEHDDSYDKEFPAKRRIVKKPVRYKATARDYVAADGCVPTAQEMNREFLEQ